MTKDMYFEMCEQLGTQPVEEEIPLELGDFPMEIQQIFSLYDNLEDKVSDFSGVFTGKVYTNFPLFYDIFCEGLPITYVLYVVRYMETVYVEQAIKQSKSKNKVDLAK